MRPIRLLSFVEANTITGPAKNLLQFASLSHEAEPPVETGFAVFLRDGVPSLFADAARRASFAVYPLAEKGRFDLALFPQLRSAVRDFQPDLIQSHGVKAHFLIRAAGLHRTIPWVAFHHGYTRPDLRMRLYNQLDRWSLRAAAAVVTVSRPFRAELVRFGIASSRIEVVHNAVDPCWGSRETAESRQALRASLGIPPYASIVLIVGRLSSEKDHATLLAAFQRLRGSAPHLHLLIVGDGPERERIQSATRRLGIEDSVKMAGQVPTAEPYYGIAEIAVLSSRSEGSPNALLEAMAAGVPVVATTVGGIPEIVSHGESALLIPPGDPGAMAHAIAGLAGSSGLRSRLAGCAQETVRARHSPLARVRRLTDIYRQVLGRSM